MLWWRGQRAGLRMTWVTLSFVTMCKLPSLTPHLLLWDKRLLWRLEMRQNELRMNRPLPSTPTHSHTHPCAHLHSCQLERAGEPSLAGVHQEQIRVKVLFTGKISFPDTGWDKVVRVICEKIRFPLGMTACFLGNCSSLCWGAGQE